MNIASKLLVVDDNSISTSLYAATLGRYGFQVFTADSGLAALNMLEQGLEPELILMDIELGGEMDGIEATRRINERWNYPVIFLSANTYQQVMEKIRNVKAYSFIPKGASPEVVITVIDMARRLKEESDWSVMFRDLFNRAGAELYLFRQDDLHFVEVNQAALKNLGYSLQEMRGLTPFDIKSELQFATFKNYLNQLQAEGHQEVLFETLHRRKDGSLYPVQILLQKFRFNHQPFYLAVGQDLTILKNLQEDFNKTNLLYSALMQDLNEAVIISQDKTIVLWNKRAEALFGISRAEALGEDLAGLLFPGGTTLEQIKEQYPILSGSPTYGTSATREVEFTTPNGKPLTLEISCNSMTLGGHHFSIVIARDLTDRKRYEQEILEHNRTMSLFIEGMVSPAWLLDKERQIILQNKAAEAEFHTRVGDYCWGAIQHCRLSNQTNNEQVEVKPTHCSFCRSESSLSFQQKQNDLIEIDGTYWDVWWIPLGTDVYLHYAINVTRYKEMEKKLELLAVTDGLLGIYNRRFTTQRLQSEVYRARRYGSKFSVILMDIDHFKSYNDNFGHDAGDLVLKTVVTNVQNRLRQSDILGRWGGEEFLILAPETPRENAAILAEKIRSQIETIEIPNLGRITASFGVASYEQDDTDETIVKRADSLLYRAKQEGRNRVCS